MLSYLYLALGSLFYFSHFPECYFTPDRGYSPSVTTFIITYLQSHTWWHLFIFLNSYQLLHLSFAAVAGRGDAEAWSLHRASTQMPAVH